jgi:Mg-chelatase subunit ChlD
LTVFAADLSPSMAGTYRLSNRRITTRIEALKQAAAFYFTQQATVSPRTQICVVGFSANAQLVLDWTPLKRLEVVVRSIRLLEVTEAYTNIAGALTLSLDRIRAVGSPVSLGSRPKVLLVTDGAGNVDTNRHESLIKRARHQGVQLHTVAICNRRDDPTTYDRDLLARMARKTRGRFHTAHSLDQLKQALCRAR